MDESITDSEENVRSVYPGYIFADPFFPDPMYTHFGGGHEGGWIFPEGEMRTLRLSAYGDVEYRYMPEHCRIEGEGAVQPPAPDDPEQAEKGAGIPSVLYQDAVDAAGEHIAIPSPVYRLLCSRQITALQFFFLIDFCLHYDERMEQEQQRLGKETLTEQEKKKWILSWMQTVALPKHLFDEIYPALGQLEAKKYPQISGEGCPYEYYEAVADYLKGKFCNEFSRSGNLTLGTKKIMWFRKVPQYAPYSVIFHKGKKIAKVDYASTGVFDMENSIAIIGLEHGGYDAVMSELGFMDAQITEPRKETSTSSWSGYGYGGGAGVLGLMGTSTTMQGQIANYHFTHASLVPYMPNPFGQRGKGVNKKDLRDVSSMYESNGNVSGNTDPVKPDTTDISRWGHYVADYPSYILYVIPKADNYDISIEEGERPTDRGNPSLIHVFRINDLESPAAFDDASGWREPWETGGVQSGVPITGAMFPFHGKIESDAPFSDWYNLMFSEERGLFNSMFTSQFDFIRSKPLFSKNGTAVCGTNSGLLRFDRNGAIAQYDIENFKKIEKQQ